MLSIDLSNSCSGDKAAVENTSNYRQHRLKYLPSISTTIGLEVFSTAAFSPAQGILRSIDNVYKDLNIYHPFPPL
jgi:hypothetical protein